MRCGKFQHLILFFVRLPPTTCFSFNVESNHVKQSHSKLNARNNLSFTPISLCHSCQKKIMSKLHRSEHFCFLKLDELFFWWSVNRLDIFLIRPLCRHGIFCAEKTPTASPLHMYGMLYENNLKVYQKYGEIRTVLFRC